MKKSTIIVTVLSISLGLCIFEIRRELRLFDRSLDDGSSSGGFAPVDTSTIPVPLTDDEFRDPQLPLDDSSHLPAR
jgi:hypothetical protein